MRNPAAAHANTLGTPKVGAPSSSASGNRSKNATATTAPALKPSTHCKRAARRSASSPPVHVVQNAAPDSASSNIADLAVGAEVESCRVGAATTGIAQSLDLQVTRIGGKAGGLDPLSQQPGDGRIAEFSDCTAGAADQKLSRVQVLRRLATQVGVQGVDTVDQSRTHQKAQSTVHRRRRVLTTLLAQSTQNVVSADGRMARPNELQHAFAGGGQIQAALGAHLIGRVQGFGHAAPVIVPAARVRKAACR